MFFSHTTLRAACLKDLNLISQTILHDAKNGHYSELYCTNDEARRGLQVNLKSMIEHECRINTVVKNNVLINETLFSRVITFEKGQNPIGFSIISSSDDAEHLEIWMFSIHNDFRNKGYGQKALNKLLRSIAKAYPQKDIVARCFDSSETMINLLQKENFIEEKSPYEARFFRLKAKF